MSSTSRLSPEVDEMPMPSLAYGVNAGYAINPAHDLGPRLFA